MKITNLHQQYLQGLVDMAISDYTEHVSKLPEFCGMSYGFEFGLTGGEKDSVKITFDWMADTEQVCIDKEANSYEIQGTNCSESILISAGDKISKLQAGIQYILQEITK